MTSSRQASLQGRSTKMRNTTLAADQAALAGPNEALMAMARAFESKVCKGCQ